MSDSKGLYNVGKSHAEGGIPAINVDTGQHIEVELNEYKICNSAYSSNKILRYSNKTNKEILDDIHDNFSCRFNKNEVKNGEFILCKVVVLDPAKRNRKGTVKKILDEMQSEKSCNVSQGSTMLEDGGIIPTEKHIYLGKEGGSNVSEQGMFEKAVSMNEKGIDSETIRKQTGWFLNKFDNLWRYEISDEDAEIDYDYLEKAIDYVLELKTDKPIYVNLNKFYKNDLLSKAYPTIGNINVLFSKNLKAPAQVVTGTSVATKKQGLYIEIDIYDFKKRIFKHGLRGDGISRANGGATVKAIITHELQHVVQIREGLSGGSSTSREFKKLLEKRKNGLLRPNKGGTGVYGNDAESILYLNDLAKKNYLNHLGEIEARDSDTRILFDKETRIEIPPYTLISFNDEDVISNLEDKIVFEQGGEISEHDKIYKEWTKLVNMSASELKAFMKTDEGKDAGLDPKEAKRLGIGSGQESAKWILKMKAKSKDKWTLTMWDWAKRQINFINRMRGNKGKLFDENGMKTRKHTSLLIWGHLPMKFEDGGEVGDLDNSEKLNTFASLSELKNQIDYVINGKSENRTKSLIEKARLYIRGNVGESKNGQKQVKIKEQEKEHLINFAVENDILFLERPYNKYIAEGSEQKVFYYDNQNVVKYNDSFFYESWQDYLLSLELHNVIFPDTKYDLIGFLLNDNNLYSIVVQTYVRADSETDLAKVKDVMLSNTFVNKRGNDYYSEYLGVILEDLHDENVFTFEDNLYFIDTVFYALEGNKMQQGGQTNETKMEKIYYHVSENPNLIAYPYLHAGSKSSAIIRGEHLKYENPFYYTVKVLPNAKIVKASDMVANIIHSKNKGFVLNKSNDFEVGVVLNDNKQKVNWSDFSEEEINRKRNAGEFYINVDEGTMDGLKEIENSNADIIVYDNEIEGGESIMVVNPNVIELGKTVSKYHLGGDMTQHLAPNGKPSNLNHEQWHLVRTPEFKAWFGDWEKLALTKINDSGIDDISLKKLEDGVSKVLDSNGEPLVCWHGTSDKFSVFDKKKIGQNYIQSEQGGFFFTQKKQSAENYAKIHSNLEGIGYVYACFLNIKNPVKAKTDSDYYSPADRYDINRGLYAQQLRVDEGLDGVIIIGTKKDNLYVALHPNQIKLADGTNTTFDGDNPDIRFEDGGETLSGGLSDNKTIEDIAKMHNVSLDYAKSQLEKGIKVELEHTNDTQVAKEISLDHLYEKINYYIDLEKMESMAIQTNAFVESEIDNEPTLFDSNKGVQKFEYGGSITDVGNWGDVPNEWRNISKISKSKFTPIPTDKGFQSFIKPFLGVDEINPRFLGVNYDEKNIVSTNGHILIVMPNTTDLKGILVTRDFRSGYKVGDSIDMQYVNYEAVIPSKAPYSYKIDCYKLYQFVSAAMNYANQTTYQIVLRYDTDKHIGFNAKLLLAALKSCIQLGYESIYIHLDSPNRAALLTPKKEYEASNVEEFLILIMPVMLLSDVNVSAMDIDYNRSLYVNYQLDTDQIVNADGSIAKFQMDYGKGDLFDEKDVTLLNKIRPKKATLPILENIAVVNGDLMASDLSNTITIKQDKAKDGIYGVLNGVPYIDKSIDLDEFPIVKNDGKKKIFDVDTQFFKWIVGKALNFVGNDELRPAMTGLHLKKVTYGNGYKISIEATDARILLKYDITDYITDVDNEDFDVIINPKYLYAFCDYTENETLEFSLSFSEKRAYFTDGKATLKSRLIDERYPNIEQVIPFTSQNTFELNTIDIKDIVSSKVIKDFKKNPSQNSSGISVYGELTDDDKVIVYATESEYERRGYQSAQKLIRKEKIGEYDVLYNMNAEEDVDSHNISLIMPVMPDEGIDGKIIFNFNPKFLEEITTGVKSNKVKFGYTELSRAYIIQGEAMEYVPAKKNVVKKVAKEVEVAPKSPLDNLISIMNSKYNNQGYTLKQLYDEVIRLQGSVDGALIFSEFIKRQKDAGNEKVINEFNETSFVENIIPVDSQKSNNEELQTLIDGYNVLLEIETDPKEKEELENLILGLTYLMDSDVEGLIDTPVNVNQKKIDALLKRREKAEESLDKANRQETERFSRLGWGSGMRMGKLNVSYSKSDAARERLKNIDKELETLGYVKMAQGGQINNAIMRELKSADVKTGQPISFYYSHAKNKQKTPNFGAKYGQNIEPHGKYIISVSESYGKLEDNDKTSYEYGVITLNNPLVLEHKSTDDKGWKKDLMEMFGGKKGSALSKEIIKKGYDGIITTDGNYVSEIVALNEFKMEQGGSTSIDHDYVEQDYSDEISFMKNFFLKKDVKFLYTGEDKNYIKFKVSFKGKESQVFDVYKKDLYEEPVLFVSENIFKQIEDRFLKYQEEYRGGSFLYAKGGSTSIESEEDEIMRAQFGDKQF